MRTMRINNLKNNFLGFLNSGYLTVCLILRHFYKKPKKRVLLVGTNLKPDSKTVHMCYLIECEVVFTTYEETKTDTCGPQSYFR